MPPKKRHLGFGLILLGLCFFFNPYFAGVDVLPDFLGCALIWLALLPYARISHPMAEARVAFARLAIADLCKNFLLLMVFGMGASNEQSTMLLTLAFAGAVVGLFFALPALRSLFDGIDYLALSYDCKGLYAVPARRRETGYDAEAAQLSYSRTERLKRFTMVFIVIREACCLLPEFAALLNSSYVDSPMTRLYDYIGVMRILAYTPVVLLGLVWLVRIVVYFLRAQREKAFRQRLGEVYDTYMAEHPGVRVKTRHGVAFTLLVLGAVLTADFYIDFQNVIPDAFAALFFTAGILLLQLPLKKRLLGVLAAAAFGVASTVSAEKAYYFSMNFTSNAISRSEPAAAAYFDMWFSALGEMAAFLLLLLALMLLLRETVARYAGYRPEYIEAGAFESRSLVQLREELDGLLIKCYVLGFTSAVCTFLYDYVKEWPNKRAYRVLEFLWMPDFFFAVLFACYLGYVLVVLMQQIRARYMYE